MEKILRCEVEHEAADRIHISVHIGAGDLIQKVEYKAITTLTLLKWLRFISDDWVGKSWDVVRQTKFDIPSTDQSVIRQVIRSLHGDWKLPYEEGELCHCRSVPTPKVLRALRLGCRDVEGVGRQTSAGTACGSCRKDSEKLIRYVIDIS